MATVAVRPSERTFKGLLLELLPRQGNWSEEQYLDLTDHSNRLVEFTDGYLEFLPRPTTKHQLILKFLLKAFERFLEPLGGLVLFALRVKIREEKFREPDLIAVKRKDDPRAQERFWTGADLVVEVVSKDKPQRDLVDKRRDYAEGRIQEYW